MSRSPLSAAAKVGVGKPDLLISLLNTMIMLELSAQVEIVTIFAIGSF